MNCARGKEGHRLEIRAENGSSQIAAGYFCIIKTGKLPYNMPNLEGELGVPMTAAATSRSRATKQAPARLEARISNELHTTVKRAAKIQGRTMTDFVIMALQEAARQAIEQSELMRLSAADQQAFASALIDPPKPNAALKRAFVKGRKLLVAP